MSACLLAFDVYFAFSVASNAPYISHADAVSERLKERERRLDLLARLVPFLPLDEKLGELELDHEPAAFQVWRQA